MERYSGISAYEMMKPAREGRWQLPEKEEEYSPEEGSPWQHIEPALASPQVRAWVKSVVGIDLPTPKPIGSGHWGTAYDIGGGIVLKGTLHESEARSNAYIVGKKFKNVAEVYSVACFSEGPFRGICFVLSENAGGSLSTDETVAVNNMIDPSEVEDKHRTMIDQSLHGAEELLKYGIVFEDWKGPNIAKKGNTYKIIDVIQERGGELAPLSKIVDLSKWAPESPAE